MPHSEEAEGKNLAGTDPVLTIAIPTWNRAGFLALTLAQLHSETRNLSPDHVEILVSDNASTDETPSVVDAICQHGLAIRSVRNTENIGSDANIAQCFNLARGRYVLLLGDDDILIDGLLGDLLPQLTESRFGVVCLRPYGYVRDFRAEYPGGSGTEAVFDDPGRFLAAILQYSTLISACVIHKAALGAIDARRFVGGNLVQVHLVLMATLAARHNLFVTRYSVACKRANSGGYDFSRVFVTELWRIYDLHAGPTMSETAMRRIESGFLLSYYPFNLLRQRLARAGDLGVARANFRRRFGDRPLFWLWLGPILFAPRPFALAWAAGTTAIGRIVYGDLRRGLTFLKGGLGRRIGPRGGTPASRP